MTWPRAFALSESVWSPKGRKNWPDFVNRIEQQFKRFDEKEIKYSTSMYDPAFAVERNAAGQLFISLRTEVPGLDIYFSFDNSFPDRFYPKYSAPITPPTDATQIRVITYRGTKPVGRMITIQLKDLQARLPKAG